MKTSRHNSLIAALTSAFTAAFTFNLLTACEVDEPEPRSLDVIELRTPGEHLDFVPLPLAQILCCKNPGGCSEPNADGTCPGDTVATCCADEETCNAEACWFECGPAYCPPNS